MKVYGPYLRKDNRKHVCIVHSDGRRQTKSYPKYLLEQHLGRELLAHETVDHINNDFTDDRIENLQILTLAENAIKEYARSGKTRKLYTFICPVCNKEATKYLNHVLNSKKQGNTGPYCSRSCAGKASSTLASGTKQQLTTTGIKTMEEAYNALKYNLTKASNTLDASLCIKYTQAALNAAQVLDILNNLQLKKQERVDPYLQTR